MSWLSANARSRSRPWTTIRSPPTAPGWRTGLKQDPREPSEEVVSVDLDRIRVTVEPPAEWTQMYHEAWRLMRDNFWRADMGGGDLAAAGDRYRPPLGRLRAPDV